MILDDIKARGEELSVLQGHDRLQYIIDIARDVEPLKDKHKNDGNKIKGCVSNLWVTGKILPDGNMKYNHDAESWITKGTAKIILDLVNGKPRSEVAQLTLDDFVHLGIREMLTMQRQVGYASLIERVVGYAKND